MNQRRAAVFLPLFIVFSVLLSRFVGCSSQTADAFLSDSDGGGTRVATTCGTPAEGCSCPAAGSTVACGQVDLTRDGFTQCSYGTRTCTAAGTWGACEGAVHIQSLVATPSSGLHPRDLQDDASACGSIDLCDPYCNGFTDTPVGLTPLPTGLTLVDGGGLTISPTSEDGGSSIPGTLQTTSTGLSTCGGGLNAAGGGCSAPGPTACAQDFRCDTPTHTCVWNGGAGYHDNSLGGADLTIGAGCSFGGVTTFPVCNRGSTSVAEGTALNVSFVGGTTMPDGCAANPTTTCAGVAPTGGLAPGSCVNVPCTIPETGGFAVVNPGDPTSLEAAGWCGNNIAFAQTANGADTSCATCTYCDTRVTGTVHDPGLNPDALRDVTVYELAGTSGTLPPLPDNVGGTTAPPCDTCESLLPPSAYSVATNTDNLGTFTLTNVTPGPNQTIVAQTGRWRRPATVPITACQTKSLDDDVIRLPKNQSEGSIPKIAFIMGGAESLECWLLKVGIDKDEMQAYGSDDAARVQLFFQSSTGDGLTVRGSVPPNPDDALWSASGPLNDFSAVMMSCNGLHAIDEGSGPRKRVFDYANAGGRLFMDHWHGVTWLANSGAPFNWNDPSISTWGSDVTPTQAANGRVQNTKPAQQKMYEWLGHNAADNWDPPFTGDGTGWLESDNPRHDAVQPGTSSTEWIRGETSNDWVGDPGGNYSLSFSFETPYGASTTCGRVLQNGMHASQIRAPGGENPYGDFPGSCVTDGIGLSPEEMALEYQLFQLTACALGGAPPPASPPPPPPLMAATFTRDFHGVCLPGYRVVWQAFNWDADLPPGTTIAYFAATASDGPDGGEPDLPAMVSLPPATVPIGIATMTTLAPSWGTDAHTVDWHLQNEPPGPAQQSQDWLRVYMVLEPTATTAPTLYDWQQLYDCVPDQ